MDKQKLINSPSDAFKALGDIKVFHDMFRQEEGALIMGLREVLEFDHPILSDFIFSDDSKVILRDSKNEDVKVRYVHEGEVMQSNITFDRIEFFIRVFRKEVLLSLEDRAN